MKKLSTIVLTAVLLFAALGAKSCNKYDRVVLALQAAPALINSFTNSTPEERARLTQWFNDAVVALQAYKLSRTGDNWSAFLEAFDKIAREHVSDSKGAARIAAIVVVVRILLGIPGTAGIITARRQSPPTSAELDNIKAQDVKELERLMKPLP